LPNCSSMFTRSFNLKGHIHSHTEEKPLMCKWPGCAKSFASGTSSCTPTPTVRVRRGQQTVCLQGC
ncbi:hypothetical protein DFH09DRAFT_850850, partial [Mycena vulgaris]